jgi:hypothetical protein
VPEEENNNVNEEQAPEVAEQPEEAPAEEAPAAESPAEE